jgi:uncharacterized membrane protein YfcA
MDVVIAVPLGFLLGFLIGLTGVGGGALVAPALYVILGVGYGPAVALSLVYSLFTKVVGAAQHLRQGTVLWPITLLYGGLGIPGAVLGSRLVYAADPAVQQVLPMVMGVVLLGVATLLLMETAVRALASYERPLSPREISWPVAAGVGVFQLGVGTLLGITSVGSGSLIILSMLYLFRMSAPEIVGSNIVISLIMVIPAGITHYWGGGLEWGLLAALSAGSLGGAVLGARTTLVIPERTLKLCIGGLVILAGVATLLKALS